MTTEQQMTDMSIQSTSVMKLSDAQAVNNALTDLSAEMLPFKYMASAQLIKAETQLLMKLKVIQQQK